jgi:uncharacterized protein (TIGR02996 family)
MDTEAALLAGLCHDLTDDVAWLALADWLEEHDRADQARLLRLHRALRTWPEGQEKIERSLAIQEMINGGVSPAGPRLVNSIRMELVLIPPGTFIMGSVDEEEERYNDEGPRHEVDITRPFYLGAYLVTQDQYKRVMGSNPSGFSSKGSERQRVKGIATRSFPVEMVSWDDAVEFCRRLSEMPAEKQARRTYRLPSEAEWEYACRAWGSSEMPFYFGTVLKAGQAWFDWSIPYGSDDEADTPNRPCAVGSFPPNAFGLYDMHGNVDEWCADWYKGDYYEVSPRRNPQGPKKGDQRVLRGGSYFDDGAFCRTAVRYFNAPDEKRDSAGFRVVCEWRRG